MRAPRCTQALRRGLLGLLAMAPACTLEPAGTQDEFEHLARAGGAYSRPAEQRELPPLAEAPELTDVVTRALLAHGGLEAAWHRWRAALERVLVASGWPNTDVAVGLTSFVEHGALWDTSAVTLGFDPMEMLLLPSKVRTAGEAAFESALAAGMQFEQQRLALREEVVQAWVDWSLLAERLRLAELDDALVASLEQQATVAVATGAAQQTLLARQVDRARSRVALQTLRSEVPAQRAVLNALLGRTPDAPLALPTALPDPRPLPLADEELLAAGVLVNPRLGGMAHDSAERAALLRLAGLRGWPNLAPSAQAGGGMPESYGVMITLPINVDAVRAATRQAQAELDAAEAELRQERLDELASFTGTLAALRNDERTVSLLRHEVLPAARAVASHLEQVYVTGSVSLSDLVDSQRAILEVELTLAEAASARERRLATLERLGGLDLERLAADTTRIPPGAAIERPEEP